MMKNLSSNDTLQKYLARNNLAQCSVVNPKRPVIQLVIFVGQYVIRLRHFDK